MKKKTIIILIAALLVCIAIAVAAIAWFQLFNQRSVLYFNIDGYSYQDPVNTAISQRKPGSNGVYQLDMLVNGQRVTCHTDDPDLVNKLDSQQVLCLEVSGSGEIKSATSPGKPLYNQDVIQSIGENELVLNTSLAYTGGQSTVKLAKDCKFYDLAEDGAYTEPEIMDEVLIYGNALGEATDVFILRRVPHTKLYWRLDRQYDSKTLSTTRKPDADGCYTATFSVEGQQVELKCRDPWVMSSIDAATGNDAAMGLVLDEDGFITEKLPAYRTLRGRQICSMYDVVAIENGQISLICKQNGDLYGQRIQIKMDPDCQIFNVSDGAEQTGQAEASLLVGDRVTVYSDPLGIATHIFIHVRLVDVPFYFNMLRMYAGGHTTRKPDADGFYNFAMLCDGEVVNVRTKDENIATRVDKISSRGMGLALDGDIILRVYDVSCVTGNSVLAYNRYVHSFSQGMVVSTNANFKGMSYTLLHKDCKIYNATGEETQLQTNDYFIAFGNADNEATYIFIIGRK